jgi:hypothetical protein
MKNLFKLILVFAFFIIPVQSFAVTSSISDGDLNNIVAQVGSITVRIGEIPVASQSLKSISTDGWNFWDSDHDITNHLRNPHPNNTDGNFNGTSDTNLQKYPGAGSYDKIGYFGYDEIYLTGGTVIHSGSMTLEVVSTNDPNVRQGCKLDVVMNNSSINAPIAVLAVVKLGKTPDFSDNQQALGRTYTAGITSTTNGHLTVYAHNNSLAF